VGVDVERVRPFDMDLAERFFTPQENAFLRSAPEAERQLRFFDLWTLKESFLKAVGCGLAAPLNSFSVLPEGADFRLEAEGYAGYRLQRLPFDPGYRLSLCSLQRDFSPEVAYLPAPDLCEAFLSAS
jgi:4'-phosphopantetheinyl transferase